MPAEIVFVGWTCPLCGSRVSVLRSSDAPKALVEHEVVSECRCGFIRRIRLFEIQLLEVWRESAAQKKASLIGFVGRMPGPGKICLE